MLPLYENIKSRREFLELSQEQLAERTGYTSRSSIAKIEKGLVDLPLSKIEVFAEALETTPSELMGDTWEESYILDNARLDIINAFNGDPYQIAKFQEAERIGAEQEDLTMPAKFKQASSYEPKTIAAHHEGEDWTEEELEEIERFKAFVRSKRG